MTSKALMGSSAPQSSPLSAAQRFTQALALVPEIAEVEKTIRSTFSSDVAAMRDIPEYLLALGGKRIRPILTLLSAKALGAKTISRDIITVAAGIELIHMATLMHDDIIDESPIRRHKPSPYAQYGTPLTLLSGDFLLTRAFGLCAKLDDEIIVATEQACIELVEGEALETPLHIEPHSRASSRTIAERKTASLFRLAAFCAAHLTGADPATTEALCTFGQSLGVAFQFIDDILDVLSDEATLGKRPGLDIAERKPSLVNVLWLESGDPAAQRLLQSPQGDEEAQFVTQSLKVLTTGPVMDRAKELAKKDALIAADALRRGLGVERAQSPEGQALFSVIDFALERML
jgi:geranylgeranyl pyrophosphate synthase